MAEMICCQVNLVINVPKYFESKDLS